MTQVLAVAAQGPRGPSFRVRCLALAPKLNAEGVDLVPRPLFSRSEALEFAESGAIDRASILANSRRRLRTSLESLREGVSCALVCRQVDLSPMLSLEKLVAEDRRLVYDVDDAIWLGSRRDSGGHPLALLKRARVKARWLAQRADHVMAGNELLAAELGSWSNRVSVVPSLVDAERIRAREHADAETLTVGWIGSSTTAHYLDSIAEALSRLAHRVAPQRLRLLTVGGMPTRPIEGVVVEHASWSESAELDALARIDIGVMPLPNNPWTRGKCSYKSIQYMAAGVPVVSDDVGLAARTIGGGGYAVSGSGQWLDALVALGDSLTLRRTMGAAGRHRARSEFSIQTWAPTIAELLKQ